MSAHEGRLTIAVQKSGRLAERSLELMQEAGLSVVKGVNELFYRVESQPVELLRVRDDDIPTLVADGVADLGVVGLNVLAEQPQDIQSSAPIAMRLGFGRCELKIAIPNDCEYSGADSLNDKRIATSYPNVLRRFLKDRSIDAHIVEMRGSVEAAPRLNLAHAICDLVSTGSTLEANGLTAKDTVLVSEAVLVRSTVAPPESLENLLESVMQRFRGVAKSRGAKYVMLNAEKSMLDRIIQILPGADAPTVVPLASGTDRVAVHAVCQESVFWETLEDLKAIGASGILVLPIEKMM